MSIGRSGMFSSGVRSGFDVLVMAVVSAIFVIYTHSISLAEGASSDGTAVPETRSLQPLHWFRDGIKAQLSLITESEEISGDSLVIRGMQAEHVISRQVGKSDDDWVGRFSISVGEIQFEGYSGAPGESTRARSARLRDVTISLLNEIRIEIPEIRVEALEIPALSQKLMARESVVPLRPVIRALSAVSFNNLQIDSVKYSLYTSSDPRNPTDEGQLNGVLALRARQGWIDQIKIDSSSGSSQIGGLNIPVTDGPSLIENLNLSVLDSVATMLDGGSDYSVDRQPVYSKFSTSDIRFGLKFKGKPGSFVDIHVDRLEERDVAIKLPGAELFANGPSFKDIGFSSALSYVHQNLDEWNGFFVGSYEFNGLTVKVPSVANLELKRGTMAIGSNFEIGPVRLEGVSLQMLRSGIDLKAIDVGSVSIGPVPLVGALNFIAGRFSEKPSEITLATIVAIPPSIDVDDTRVTLQNGTVSIRGLQFLVKELHGFAPMRGELWLKDLEISATGRDLSRLNFIPDTLRKLNYHPLHVNGHVKLNYDSPAGALAANLELQFAENRAELEATLVGLPENLEYTKLEFSNSGEILFPSDVNFKNAMLGTFSAKLKNEDLVERVFDAFFGGPAVAGFLGSGAKSYLNSIDSQGFFSPLGNSIESFFLDPGYFFLDIKAIQPISVFQLPFLVNSPSTLSKYIEYRVSTEE